LLWQPLQGSKSATKQRWEFHTSTKDSFYIKWDYATTFTNIQGTVYQLVLLIVATSIMQLYSETTVFVLAVALPAGGILSDDFFEGSEGEIDGG